MPTVPLPPWMRRIQQSFWWQIAMLPMLVGFLGSLILQGCLADVFAISLGCVKGAVNATVLTLLTSWVKGHSSGSSDFKSDGTPLDAAPKLKQLADTAIALQAKATDPSSPVTQAEATDAAQTVTRVDAVVSNVLASTEAKKP
jgi:hypothetical protein